MQQCNLATKPAVVVFLFRTLLLRLPRFSVPASKTEVFCSFVLNPSASWGPGVGKTAIQSGLVYGVLEKGGPKAGTAWLCMWQTNPARVGRESRPLPRPEDAQNGPLHP